MRSQLASLRPQLTEVRRPLRVAGIVAVCLLVGTCSQPPSILEQIRQSGVLKVVTRNSPTAYYLGVEGPEGPEYELASGFAKWLGVDVSFQVAPSGAAALTEIRHNRAHIAAAGIVASGDRRSRLAFGPTYQLIKQHIVCRQQEAPPRTAADLVGKRIEVVAGSTHAHALAALAAQVPGLTYKEVPAVDQLDLLARVSSGDIDYTVADSSEFSIGRNFHPDLRTAFELAESEPIAWALNPGDDSLAPRVREYFDKLERDGTLASILDRYYPAAGRFDYLDSLNFVRRVQDMLPELRPWFEEAGRETGIDWRLLAAIAYQESKFDARATSPTGVRGVMMLTDDTAARVGISDRLDPRSSILGGARYLLEVRGKVPDRIPEPDRTWLALAAYNIGFGHLEDARILAQRLGGDPDSWKDVRARLPLLAQERWYTQTKHGYARGWEPVRFVDNIRNYRDVLVWLTGDPANQLRLVNSRPPTDAGH
jgi:membrane-bound lytic murein transglycosylase F